MGYSGAGGKLIDEKNQKQKISWHCPFKPGNFKITQNGTKKQKSVCNKCVLELNFASKVILLCSV